METCKHCKFLAKNINTGLTECRRRAPAAAGTSEIAYTFWPVIDGTLAHGCGEWEENRTSGYDGPDI